jgi:hypothetical protein
MSGCGGGARIAKSSVPSKNQNTFAKRQQRSNGLNAVRVGSRISSYEEMVLSRDAFVNKKECNSKKKKAKQKIAARGLWWQEIQRDFAAHLVFRRSTHQQH